MADIDLSLLPAPAVLEAIGFEAVLAEMQADLIARYPAIADTIELESEPALKILQVAAYRETLLRARFNDEARDLLLAYATGSDLDHIGVTYYDGETRLLITPADPIAVPPVVAVWESDADFRARLALKPESYSVAGPTEAFRFHALSASGQVKAASVTSPQPGTTTVYVLAKTGDGTPDAGLIATVLAALDDETIRPLSEEVLVAAAAIVNYSIDVDLIVYPGPAGEAALAAAQAELATLAAASHTLDREVTLSAITAAAQRPGVKKNIINQPLADVVCGLGQAPYCTAIAVRIAGVEA
jgi:phage-related baseplate assembly protein